MDHLVAHADSTPVTTALPMLDALFTSFDGPLPPAVRQAARTASHIKARR